MNHDNARERDNLLSNIVVHLEADERVVGVWLAGSIGREEYDDLSDLDLWVIVDDTIISEIVQDPLAFVHAITPTIMHIPAPSIAPTEGAYLLTWVADAQGLQQVDWYWQPYMAARRPSRTQLLFERRSIPLEQNSHTIYSTPPDRDQAIDGAICDAFLMILNARKHILRANQWSALDHLHHVARCLSRLDWLLAHGGEPPFSASAKGFLPSFPPTSQHDQLELLRGYDEKLTSLIILANRHDLFGDALRSIAKILPPESERSLSCLQQ